MELNVLDLFSGIGGFHKGFEQAGYKLNVHFSEIDKWAIAVYKHNFKDAIYAGSVIDIRGEQLPQIDLITFGSPCQDFSLAGRRRGLDGERSSLIGEAIRLIRELRPKAFIWENVKGTFSSNNGEDFTAILKAFADIGGYRCEWELLNTSQFLPQNRERIYLIGYTTKAGGDWKGIFPFAGCNREDLERGIIRAGHRGTGGQQGIIYSDKGKLSTLSAYNCVDPPKIVERLKKVTDRYGKEMRSDIAPCITGSGGNSAGNNSDTAWLHSELRSGEKVTYRIRRLTPVECERLQGFPDGHTAYGNFDGVTKKMSNTQRYKQVGNAVTVDVVQALAMRLKPFFNMFN